MGSEPTDERATPRSEARDLTLTWLGQAGFRLDAGADHVLIDPFFSPHPARAYDPEPGAPLTTGSSAIFCTHEHEDHFDAPLLRQLGAAGERPAVVVPAPVLPIAAAAGIPTDQLLGARPGETLHLGGTAAHPVAAWHGLGGDLPVSYGLRTAADRDDAVRFLGYVIEIGGWRVYHSGDTLAYPGMVERLRELAVDVMLVPINGRDFMREQAGCVGNLDAAEAAWLCAAVRARLAIPMHYDAMSDNLGDVGGFVRAIVDTHAPVTVLAPPRWHPVRLPSA